MKLCIRLLALIAVSAVCILPLCGCHTPSDTEDIDTVTVCEVTHSVFYAPQYVAIAKGFFKDEGIAVELSTGEGADKVMAAVLSGSIDIGFAGPEAAIYVYNEGRDNYAQVFAQLTQRDGSFLVSRTPQPDFTWADVKGAHVLPGRVGGVPYMSLCYVLRQNGLDLQTDVKLDSSIQFALMTSAFTAGTGDYVTVFEPTASQLEANGQGYIVASVGEASGDVPYTAYFASKQYLDDNADLVTRFTRAIYRGQQWVATHSAADIADAVQEFFPDTDAAILESALKRYQDIDAWCTDPLLREDAYNRLQDIIAASGELDKKAPYSPVINTFFAAEVMQ